jgi:hypothetical protein
LATQWPAFVGNGGGSDEPDFGVVKDFLKRPCGAGLRELFQEGAHSLGNRIEHPLDLGPGLNEPIALAVNMSMVEMGSSHHKIARLADRCGFSHGGMRHSISTHGLIFAEIL